MASPNTHIKVPIDGWKRVKGIYVKVPVDGWKPISKAYVYVGSPVNAWKQVYDIVVPGSQTFSTAGTTSWTVPYHNSIVVELWGGGGSGGNAYHGGSSAQGGNGGVYKKYTIAKNALTVGQSYTVVVGAGGTGRNGNVGGLAGGYSQFANRVWAQGGKGGNGSENTGQAPATYTPTESATGFTENINETGGVGGTGTGSGGSKTYAGGGGGGMVNDGGQGNGGSSTYGGAGGNGGDGGENMPRNAYAPGGGGGSAEWESVAGYGGTGRIKITWS
jgi:hypothetical protein